MSEYYTASGYPANNASGSSASMRTELGLISAGLDKLPTLAANGSKLIAVNSGATALEAITTTGTGSGVRATSPTLVTPTIGVATATSVNKYTLTQPATGCTLAIADGKTLTASNTITFTATDGSTLAIGTGGTLGTCAYQSASSVTLTGGTINGTVIGGSTPAAATVTTLAATSGTVGGNTIVTITNSTFTPKLADASSGGNEATTDSSTGTYRKINGVMHFSITLINVNTTGLTAGNQAFITGLPEAASLGVASGRAYFTCGCQNVTMTSGNALAYVDHGSTVLKLLNPSATAMNTSLLVSALTSTSADIFISGSYPIAV